RVQGQPQAIGPVIDLLALLRTRLSQRHKPLASLLLIGPTGTGKTELSKTLAEFLFQDRQRLLRLDMSEYGDALAAARLIGGPGLGEGLLTGRVREQPFCVILLDEFEKADPACFDLLLQVLGEGRLSDGRGRTADFSNAVIIMTSNLGAASFGQPEPGFASPAQAGTQASRAAEGHFRKAVQQFLRPEMYNRIDAIVPFHPLDQATLRALARREWARALQRDGLSSRPLVCELSDEALDYLAARGWDPRYGARPLKRALEREALLPLAAALNLYPAHQRLEARLSLEQGQIQVQVRGIERQVLDHSSGPVAVSGLRRQLQGLRRHELVRQFETQIWRIRQLQRQIEQRPKLVLSPEQQQDLQAAGPIQASLDRLARLEAECRGFELASWQALLQEQSLGQDLQPLRRALDQLLLELYRLQFSQPDRVCLVLIGLEPDWLQELAQGYAALARQRDEKLRLSCYRRAGESALRVGKDFKGGAEMPTGEELKTDKEAAGSWDDVDKPGEWLKALPARTLALALEIQGPGARAFYHGEAGKHLRQPGRGDKPDESWRQALVEIVTGPLAEYRLLPGSQLRGWIGQQTLRRSCFEREREAEDARLWRVLRYERGRLENTLDQAIEALLWLEVRKLLS
ncbi:MAG TPA: AAA family ATPase, partial [Candidatus Obscuribacterales bacterium]